MKLLKKEPSTTSTMFVTQTTINPLQTVMFIKNVSSLHKLRVTAYLFIRNYTPSSKHDGLWTTNELRNALNFLPKSYQELHFSAEMKTMKPNKTSKLIN